MEWRLRQAPIVEKAAVSSFECFFNTAQWAFKGFTTPQTWGVDGIPHTPFDD
jgi:hypothetical protein